MKILLPVVLLAMVVSGLVLWTNDKGTLDATLNTNQNAEETVKVNPKPSTGKPENRTALNLSGQGLTKVSADVFTNVELIELDLSNNKLNGALQGEIRNLQNLKILDLSDNQFSGVPAEVGQLKRLEVLNLSNNQLTGLPNELGNLSNLKLLNLSGNAYSEADLANIRKNLPATTVVRVN